MAMIAHMQVSTQFERSSQMGGAWFSEFDSLLFVLFRSQNWAFGDSKNGLLLDCCFFSLFNWQRFIKQRCLFYAASGEINMHQAVRSSLKDGICYYMCSIMLEIANELGDT
jgi:hypothetical protein